MHRHRADFLLDGLNGSCASWTTLKQEIRPLGRAPCFEGKLFRGLWAKTSFAPTFVADRRDAKLVRFPV